MSDNPDAARPPLAHSKTSQTNAPGAVNSFDQAMAAIAAASTIGSTAPTRLHIEQVRLPQFDGKNYLLFQKQFDSIAKDQSWTDTVKARKLMECLEGDTLRHVEPEMTYYEMQEALKQYFHGSRPSVEAKNTLRHFTKYRNESLETFASRIQAYADEANLTIFDKTKYMQEAFMNGISYDPALQRYIEKKTSQQENVPIVKLLKAAQTYLHEKAGSSSNPKGPRRDFNSQQQGNARFQQLATIPEQEGAPQLNVLKNGRKEPLGHDDPAVAAEVQQEQTKVQQEKSNKANNRAAASKKEIEQLKQQVTQLQEQLQNQTNNQQQNQRQGGQPFQPRAGNNMKGGNGGGFGRGYSNGPRQYNNGPRPGGGYYNNGGFYNNNNNNGNWQNGGGYRQPRPYNPNWQGYNNQNNQNNNRATQNNQNFNNGNFRQQNPNGGGFNNQQVNAGRGRGGMPQDVRLDGNQPQPAVAPQGPPAPQPQPQFKIMGMAESEPPVVDDAFGGLNPEVYPDDCVYSTPVYAEQA